MGIPIPVLFTNLVGLFLLLGAGFVSVRARLVPADATGVFSALLLKITLPATIFSAMIRPFEASFLVSSVAIAVAGLVLFLLYALLAVPAARLLRVAENGRGSWMMTTTFANTGFMGYPVALALFGEEGLSLAVMLGIPFNLLVYTLGAKQILADVSGTGAVQLSWRKLLCTGVNAATVLGLVFFCLQIPVPQAVMTPIQHLSNITTPLSMFLIGMNLAKSQVSEVFRDKDCFTAAAMRLLALPVLTWAILKPIPFPDPLIPSVILIIMSMPTAAIAPVMAEQYGCNVPLAARIVFLSSLLCIVTIPLVAMLP